MKKSDAPGAEPVDVSGQLSPVHGCSVSVDLRFLSRLLTYNYTTKQYYMSANE